MNLHSIVQGGIGAVNPYRMGTIQLSIGSATIKSGKRTPEYSPPITSKMQVQALTTKDIAHLDALNVAGSTHTIYVSGRLEGLIRSENKGGDLIVLLTGNLAGRVWLVTAVLEDWPDWTKVSVTLQNS